jgi:hypothetical protein
MRPVQKRTVRYSNDDRRAPFRRGTAGSLHIRVIAISGAAGR